MNLWQRLAGEKEQCMCVNCERAWNDYVADKFLKAEQWELENKPVSVGDKKFNTITEAFVDAVFVQSNMGQATNKGGHPRFHEIIQQMSELHDKKNTDYAAGTVEGPLGNFERVSKIKKLYPGFDWDSPFGTAMDFMLKQFDAAFTLRSQKRDSITGEPIASRLTDVAIYAVLGIILEEEEHK